MNKVIIIKYAELNTKGENINFFIKILKNNIESSLVNIKHEVTYDKGRMYITSDSIDECINKLEKIFGIHEINVGYEFSDNSIESIGNNVLKLLEDKSFKTFKVNTKRADKSYPLESMDVSRKIGGIILKNINNIHVDVHNPELSIEIEIRFNKVLVYTSKYKGLGGYPVGASGKGMLMLSGGIDSPVSGYLAMKRGVRLEAVYFDAPPHTSIDALNKVKSLCKILCNYSGYIKLHIINLTKIEEEILKNCDRDYLITIMRRYMYRITTTLAYKNNCKCIVNGESIGQVASQTLTSMGAIECVSDLPIIRPCSCLDKLDIIDISKKIGTYETSILPYEDCCTIFVPKHPVINPNKNKCLEEEKKYDFDALVKEAINNEKVIKIELNSDNNNFNDIL